MKQRTELKCRENLSGRSSLLVALQAAPHTAEPLELLQAFRLSRPDE